MRKLNNSQLVSSITDYVEKHLQEKITLEELSGQLYYSKFYLLHEFKSTTQMSLYDYIKRRRLNEAARSLLYSDQRIIELAFQLGYRSQRSFSKAFQELFKVTPYRFRTQQKEFFIEEPYSVADYLVWANQRDIRVCQGTLKDQEKILYFVQLMRGALPYLEQNNYLHTLQTYIRQGNCYLAWAKDRIIGILLYEPKKQKVENIAALPDCWELGVEDQLIARLVHDKQPHILVTTTFRTSDKLDIGYRQRLLALGFHPAEQLIEENYPTEKLVLKINRR